MYALIAPIFRSSWGGGATPPLLFRFFTESLSPCSNITTGLPPLPSLFRPRQLARFLVSFTHDLLVMLGMLAGYVGDVENDAGDVENDAGDVDRLVKSRKCRETML